MRVLDQAGVLIVGSHLLAVSIAIHSTSQPAILLQHYTQATGLIIAPSSVRGLFVQPRCSCSQFGYAHAPFRYKPDRGRQDVIIHELSASRHLREVVKIHQESSSVIISSRHRCSPPLHRSPRHSDHSQDIRPSRTKGRSRQHHKNRHLHTLQHYRLLDLSQLLR